jgi:RHS repeat-associated protein
MLAAAKEQPPADALPSGREGALPLAADPRGRVRTTPRLSENSHQGVRAENHPSHRRYGAEKPANALGKSPAVRWNRVRSCCTGRENDATGLYFYRARYYSPTYQRFVSQDPIGFRGGDPNLYAYVSNGSTNWIDPWGLLKLPPDPSGLPPGWKLDPTHQYPFGQRYTDPYGRWLDWHPGNPTSPRGGWNQRPHWHCSTRPGQHLSPGEDIPELDVPPPGGGNPSSAPPGDQMPPEESGAGPAPEAAPPATVPEGEVPIPDDIPPPIDIF